jgi:hypothetical protein
MHRMLYAAVPILAACGSTQLERIEPVVAPTLTGAGCYAGSSSFADREPADFSSLHDSTDPMPTSFAPREIIGVGREYTTLSLGAFEPDGDLNSFDTGFWGDLAFGRKFLVFLSVEGSVGYYETSGATGSEVYGVPLVLDARAGLPILIFEGYLGAGLGGAWVHSKASGLSSEDDFVGMWEGFVGLEAGLGGFNLGLEYKYAQTDKADGPGGSSFNVEGSVFSLTGTIPW